MWYEVRIEPCHRDDLPALEECLEALGTLSITLTDKNDDPILEPEPGTTPLWPDIVLKALFDHQVQAEGCVSLFKQNYPQFTTTIEIIADQDWQRISMEGFKPQRFGKRLWVCPSWCEPPDPNGVNVLLDPGLAFGTGNHATTSLCLEWLDQHPVKGQEVIDYGCGSGILAIAALKLGAAHVQAVDIDEQALQATTNNAQRNQINREQLHLGQPETLKSGTDLLIANILLTPLMALKNEFYRLLKQNGVLVVSGILNGQVEELIHHYTPLFEHQTTRQLEDWAVVAFKKCITSHT